MAASAASSWRSLPAQPRAGVAGEEEEVVRFLAWNTGRPFDHELDAARRSGHHEAGSWIERHSRAVADEVEDEERHAALAAMFDVRDEMLRVETDLHSCLADAADALRQSAQSSRERAEAVAHSPPPGADVAGALIGDLCAMTLRHLASVQPLRAAVDALVASGVARASAQHPLEPFLRSFDRLLREVAAVAGAASMAAAPGAQAGMTGAAAAAASGAQAGGHAVAASLTPSGAPALGAANASLATLGGAAPHGASAHAAPALPCAETPGQGPTPPHLVSLEAAQARAAAARASGPRGWDGAGRPPLDERHLRLAAALGARRRAELLLQAWRRGVARTVRRARLRARALSHRRRLRLALGMRALAAVLARARASARKAECRTYAHALVAVRERLRAALEEHADADAEAGAAAAQASGGAAGGGAAGARRAAAGAEPPWAVREAAALQMPRQAQRSQRALSASRRGRHAAGADDDWYDHHDISPA